MSHFTLRMGDLLHLLPFAHRNRPWLSKLQRPSLARVVSPRRSARVEKENLEFFGLCKEASRGDDRAELGRLSLSTDDEEATNYMDESWLALL